MKQKRLIKEYICGVEGEGACVVDAQDRTLRTSTVLSIMVEGMDVWIETRNSIYCTAKWYSFGGIEKMLVPAKEAEIKVENAVRYYDVSYEPQDVSVCDTASVVNGTHTVSAEEDCDMRSIMNAICGMFPNRFFLRQFCRVHGVYRNADAMDPNFTFRYETARILYVIEVSLLQQHGYDLRIYCCRK